MKASKAVLITILIMLGWAACSSIYCEKGEGTPETITLNLETIDDVNLYAAGNLNITQGDVQRIEVTAEPNILAALENEVKDGKWKIGFKKGCYRRYNLDINLVVKDLEGVALSGSGTINIGDFELDELDLRIAGSGEIFLNELSGLESISTSIAGSGDIKFEESSKAANSKVHISGSGNYNAKNLESERVEVKIAGSGNCKVNASSELEIKIAGSGDVYYKGSPDISQSIAGSGNIRKL